MNTTSAQIKNLEQLIAEAILEHRLTPGQHLNEAQLAKGFDVSRPAVRLALISLENAGLVKIEQNRGAFVRKATLEEAIYLFQAVAALEKSAVDVILAPGHVANLAQLATIHRKQVASQAAGRLADSVRLAIDFHVQFVALTGNPFLVDTHRKLLMQYRLVTAVFRTSIDHCALEEQHAQMLSLLGESAGVKIKRVIEAHWNHVVMGHAEPGPATRNILTALKT